MPYLEDKLSDFRTRTLDLIKDVRQYTIPLDNLSLWGVGWKASRSNVPFSKPMGFLELELDKLLTSLLGSDLNETYKLVKPAFRVVHEENGIESYLHPDDAISFFIQEQQLMVFLYRNRQELVIEDPYKDVFLRTIINDIFDKHYLIQGEKLENAAEEIKQLSIDFLRGLHATYKVDVQQLFQRYLNLLVDIHEHLKAEVKGIPVYEGVPARRIPRVDYTNVSKFVSADFEPDLENRAMMEHIRELREASGKEIQSLMALLAVSKDWGELLPDVVRYTQWKNKDPLENHKFFEPSGKGIHPIEIDDARREQIIGQDENVERLYKLLTAFRNGSPIPHVLLYGPTGTGKSLTIKALTNELDGLKMVLLGSNYMHALGQVAKDMAKRSWYTILYVDDMGLARDQYEGFKTGTQGMKKFPSNVAIIASANPEAFDHLPEAIKRRFPVQLRFNSLDLGDEAVLDNVFRANFNRLKMDYNPHIITQFASLNRQQLSQASPASVYDFLVETKATYGL